MLIVPFASSALEPYRCHEDDLREGLHMASIPALKCYTRDRWAFVASLCTILMFVCLVAMIMILKHFIRKMGSCKSCSSMVSNQTTLADVRDGGVLSTVHGIFLFAMVGLTTVTAGPSLPAPTWQLGLALGVTVGYVIFLVVSRAASKTAVRITLFFLLGLLGVVVIPTALVLATSKSPETKLAAGTALRAYDYVFFIIPGAVVCVRLFFFVRAVRETVFAHRTNAAREFPFSLPSSVAERLLPNPEIEGALTLSINAGGPEEAYLDSDLQEILQLVRTELNRGPGGEESDLLKLRSVTVVYNPALEQSFRDRYTLLSRSGRQKFVRPWPSGKEVEQAKVIATLRIFLMRLSENDYRPPLGGDYDDGLAGDHSPPVTSREEEDEPDPVPIDLVWHGALGGEAACFSICRLGFMTLSAVNSGWYGRGVYGSHIASYALYYATAGGHAMKQNMTTRGHHPLLLAWAILGHTFPVLQRMDRSAWVDPESGLVVPEDALHRFHGGYPGHDSHYALVLRGGKPIEEFDPLVYDFDEVVVWNESSLLPRYIVYVDGENLNVTDMSWMAFPDNNVVPNRRTPSLSEHSGSRKTNSFEELLATADVDPRLRASFVASGHFNKGAVGTMPEGIQTHPLVRRQRQESPQGLNFLTATLQDLKR